MGIRDAVIRPPRCSLVNVTTAESIDCLFNPTQLTEKVQVNWNRLAVPGLSHQVLQYQSTGNRELSMFWTSAQCQNGETRSGASSCGGWSASSSSITIRRALTARSVAVFTTMSGAGFRIQEAARTRSPSISTMQARQLPSAR